MSLAIWQYAALSEIVYRRATTDQRLEITDVDQAFRFVATTDTGVKLPNDEDISTSLAASGLVQGAEEFYVNLDNGDGVVDANDAQFTDLSVWRDLDQDGRSDAGELFSLADLGITSLEVNGALLGEPGSGGIVTPTGNTLRAESTFTRADGTTGRLTEAIFATCGHAIIEEYRSVL